MKPRRIEIMLGLVVSTLACGDAAQADSNSEALKAITDTADKICGAIAAAGESQNVKINGDVKAQLSGLAKRLADLGLTGTGFLESDTYAGVLRSDLPTTLNSQRECKLKVFETLQKRLLSDNQLITGGSSHPSSSGNSSPSNSFSGVNNGNLVQGGAGSKIVILNPVSRSQEALVRDTNPTKLAIRDARIEGWAGSDFPVLTLTIANETDRTARNVKVSVPQLPATNAINRSFTRPDIAIAGKTELRWPIISVKDIARLYKRPDISIMSAGPESSLTEMMHKYAAEQHGINARGLLIHIQYKDIFGGRHTEYTPVVIYSKLD